MNRRLPFKLRLLSALFVVFHGGLVAQAESPFPTIPAPRVFPRGTTLMTPGLFRPPGNEPAPLWIETERCRLPAWLDPPELDSSAFAPPCFAQLVPRLAGRWYLYPNRGYEVQIHKHRTVELSLFPKVVLCPVLTSRPFAPYLPEVGTSPGSPGVAPEISNPFGGASYWFEEDLLRLLPHVQGDSQVFPL